MAIRLPFQPFATTQLTVFSGSGAVAQGWTDANSQYTKGGAGNTLQVAASNDDAKRLVRGEVACNTFVGIHMVLGTGGNNRNYLYIRGGCDTNGANQKFSVLMDTSGGIQIQNTAGTTINADNGISMPGSPQAFWLYYMQWMISDTQILISAWMESDAKQNIEGQELSGVSPAFSGPFYGIVTVPAGWAGGKLAIVPWNNIGNTIPLIDAINVYQITPNPATVNSVTAQCRYAGTELSVIYAGGSGPYQIRETDWASGVVVTNWTSLTAGLYRSTAPAVGAVTKIEVRDHGAADAAGPVHYLARKKFSWMGIGFIGDSLYANPYPDSESMTRNVVERTWRELYELIPGIPIMFRNESVGGTVVGNYCTPFIKNDQTAHLAKLVSIATTVDRPTNLAVFGLGVNDSKTAATGFSDGQTTVAQYLINYANVLAHLDAAITNIIVDPVAMPNLYSPSTWDGAQVLKYNSAILTLSGCALGAGQINVYSASEPGIYGSDNVHPTLDNSFHAKCLAHGILNVFFREYDPTSAQVVAGVKFGANTLTGAASTALRNRGRLG